MAGLLLISTRANPLNHDTIDGERAAFGDVGPAFGVNYLYQVRWHWGLGGGVDFDITEA